MALAAKIELPDRYRVVRHIASGGMASVWEAEDLLLGRLVAVKVLGAQFAADPGARARFQREARTAAQVSDQTHVMTIYDIGEHGDDAFIVMEHFAGGTVADRLRAARDGGERIPRETAMRWLREAAAGLDVAHAAGIVHRDVKPANLLLDANDRLAVGDFGIARLADDTQMTMTGQVLGTAAYISPEQALGRPAEPASDRYALAVVAYELLTGSRPFAGGPPSAQARQHAEARPAPASVKSPGLPPALDAVLARGLAKDPEDRPRTATELVEAIESALGEGQEPEPTRAFAPASGRPRATPLVPIPPPPNRDEAETPARGRDRAQPAPAVAQDDPETPARGRDRVVPAAGAAGVAAAAGAAQAGAADAAKGAAPSLAKAGAARTAGAPAAAGARPASAPAAAGAARPAGAPAAAGAARTSGGPFGADRGDPPLGRRRAPWPALLGVAVVSAAVVGLVLALSGGGASPDGERAGRTGSTPARSESSRTATTAAAPQPPPPPPAQSSSAGASPVALNDRGHRLIQQGRYGEAIEPLRAAVQGYKAAGQTGGLPYAFALYNLAVALNRSGNPAEAVPLLRERLEYNNQRDTVQAELDDARAKLDETPSGDTKGNGKAKKDKGDRDDG